MFKHVNGGDGQHSPDLVLMTAQLREDLYAHLRARVAICACVWVTEKEKETCSTAERPIMSILHLLLHPESFHSDHIYLLHPPPSFILCLVFSLVDVNQVSGMETLTLLVCHICLYLKPFPLFFPLLLFRRESTWKTQEGETAGKCDSTENVCPHPSTTSPTPAA